MVEFTKTTQCRFYGEIYPSIIRHICNGSWLEPHTSYPVDPANQVHYERVDEVDIHPTLSDILAELRQIRQVLESRR